MKLTCGSSSENSASKANIFGAEAVGLRSSVPSAVVVPGSYSAICFFFLSMLNAGACPSSDTRDAASAHTFTSTFTWNKKVITFFKTTVVTHYHFNKRGRCHREAQVRGSIIQAWRRSVCSEYDNNLSQMLKNGNLSDDKFLKNIKWNFKSLNFNIKLNE